MREIFRFARNPNAMNKEKFKFRDSDWYAIGATMLLAILWIVFTIFGITMHMKDQVNDVSIYHNLGDTLGGILGPLVGIISAALVYITIRQQIRANEIIMETRKEDNLAAYMREYMERIEKKIDQIEKRLATNYPGTSMSKAFDKIESTIESLFSELSFEPETERQHEILNKRLDEIKLKISAYENDIIALNGFVVYCQFFSEYLLSNYLDKSLEGSRNLIAIYFHEFETMIDVSFGRHLEYFVSLSNDDMSEIPNAEEFLFLSSNAKILLDHIDNSRSKIS